MKNDSQNNLFGVKITNHSRLGKEFENELKSIHEVYRLNKLCDIVQNPSEWIYILKPNYDKFFAVNPSLVARCGDGRFMRRVASDVDFSGGGKNFSICFDSKETKAVSFPLANIKNHQMYKLAQAARCGSVAGVMVKFTTLDRVFFVSSDYLEKRQIVLLKQTGRRAARGTASISLAEMENEAVEIFRDKRNGLWDWYPQLVK